MTSHIINLFHVANMNKCFSGNVQYIFIRALKVSMLNKESDLLIRRCGFKSLLQEAFILLKCPEATVPTYQLTLTFDHLFFLKGNLNFKCIATDVFLETALGISPFHF